MVAAWNGWLIDSLVSAAMVFDRPDWLAVGGRGRRGGLAAALAGRPAAPDVAGRPAGERAGDRRGLRGAGPGRRRGWRPRPGDAAWLDRARALVAVLLEQFDDEGAGFFDTAADAETLYTRPQDPTDNATPSGLSATVHALRLLAELTGETEYAERADRAAASVGGLAGAGAAVRRLAAGRRDQPLPGRTPVQVADRRVRPTRPAPSWSAPPGGRRRPARWSWPGSPTSPGSRCWPTGRCGTAGRRRTSVAGFVCRLPVTSVEELVAQLER